MHSRTLLGNRWQQFVRARPVGASTYMCIGARTTSIHSAFCKHATVDGAYEARADYTGRYTRWRMECSACVCWLTLVRIAMIARPVYITALTRTLLCVFQVVQIAMVHFKHYQNKGTCGNFFTRIPVTYYPPDTCPRMCDEALNGYSYCSCTLRFTFGSTA